jgi:pre-mRNA-processing factor 40
MQPGSTPLDLFKFYVDSLRQQFNADARVVNDILCTVGRQVSVATTFDEFQTWLALDERAKLLADTANLRMCFNAVCVRGVRAV